MSAYHANKYLTEIQEAIGGILRESKRGVPHLVVKGVYSVCYFAKKGNFRVFDNFCARDKSAKQNRTDFYSTNDVINYFKNET